MAKRSVLLAVTILTVVGSLLRIWGISSRDLWFDEVQTWTDLQYPPPPGQPHWLFFNIARWMAGPFSDPTVAARMWPLVAGIATIPLIYLAGRRLVNEWAGLLAALVLVLSPFHVAYSQEARFYAPMILFATAGIWGALLFVQESRWWRWLGLATSGAAGWACVQHQPTAYPWVLAHHGVLGAIICFTPTGRDAVGALVKPLRGNRWWYGIGGVLVVVGALAGWSLAPKLARDAALSVFKTPWGGTEHVDFTWAFFAEHLATFGIDGRVIPHLGGVLAAATGLLLVGGVVLLSRRAPLMAALLCIPIIAQVLAVFAVSRPGTAYLVKYSCCMMPGLVLLMAVVMERVARADSMRSPRLIAVAATVAVLLAPGVVAYQRSEKMPLRVMIRWLNDNEPGSATVCLYGHMGYQAALYGGTLAARHHLVYFPWRRQEDAGILEREVLEQQASRGPTYFIRSWKWDMPAALNEFLEKEAVRVLTIPSSAGEAQEGRLYRITSGKQPELAVRDFDRFRRPGVKGTTLNFTNATAVDFSAHLKAGGVYTMDLSVRATPRQPWYLAVHSDAFDGPVIEAVLTDSDAPTTVSFVLKADRDGEFVRLAQVSDYPELQKVRGMFMVDDLQLSHIGGPLNGLRAATPEPMEWTESANAFGRWLQPSPLSENVEATTNSQTIRLSNWDGMLISPPRPMAAGSLVYASLGVRPNDLYGVGGNAGLLFIDAQGRPIQQALSSHRSHDSVIRWAPVEGPLHWKNHWYEFEAVREAPRGTAAVAVYYQFWKSDNRQYESAANQVKLRAPVLSVLKPEGSR